MGAALGAPAVAVVLGVLELALVCLAGPPGRQVEVLRQLVQVEADPLPSCSPCWRRRRETGRLPKWLRQAFGDTYSEDLIDSRVPTEEERQQLEIPLIRQ